MNLKKLIHKTTLFIFVLLIAGSAYSQVEYYGPFQHENNYVHSQTSEVYDAVINKKGDIIFTSGTSYDIIAWDLKTQEKLHNFSGANSVIYSIALSDDEKKIAGGEYLTSFKIWDTDTGKIITDWHDDQLFGATELRYITFSKDGNRIFAKMYPHYEMLEYGIYCWNALDGTLITRLDCVGGKIRGKIISDNHGDTIFTNWSKLIDVNNNKVFVDFDSGSQPINLNQNVIVYKSNNGKLFRTLYNVPEKEFSKLDELPFNLNYIIIDFSKTGRYGIFGEIKGNFSLYPKMIYDFQKGEAIYEFQELNLAPYKKVVFSDNTRFIIAVSEDNGAEVLDISKLVSSVENRNKY